MHTQTPTPAPVRVGTTDFPLKPKHGPTSLGPVPPLPRLAPCLAPSTPRRLPDGPPYANGRLHLGHVLNKHLKDCLVRAWHASGDHADWRPGWDCHGLPIELAVEKAGTARTDKLAFAAACRAFVADQVATQREQFMDQGVCADVSRAWQTSDPHMQAGVLRVLADLQAAGRLQVRTCPVPWCPQCASTLSSAETQVEPGQVTALLVPFTVLPGSDKVMQGDVLLSWTTTPWTVPLHRALVCHPDEVYVAMAHPDRSSRAWVSETTASAWARRLGAAVLDQRVFGRDLVGTAYQPPWGPSRSVIGSQRVLPHAGTGLLHAVPGLSELDSLVAAQLDLPTPDVLSARGLVQESFMAGQDDLRAGAAASKPVLDALAGMAWSSTAPHAQETSRCWRHGCDLLTRPSRQVFLHLSEDVRARAMGLLDQLQFTPASSASRLASALATRPDWCLSRQRSWGVPAALFLDRETGQPHPRSDVFMRRLAVAVETDGVEAWWREPREQWLDDGVDPSSVEVVEDVLDVWFDSGCVPFLVGSGDAVVEGTDQHRGWFQSCLWLAAALDRPPPFKHVVTHGFVVGPDGRKLSKSTGGDKGSGKTPDWQVLPSDLVRVWALSGKEGADKPWSSAGVDQAKSWLARWRGVVRFMLANALPPADEDPFLLDGLPAWDLHWWHRCRDVATEVVRLCAAAQPGQALVMLSSFGEDFSSQALGSWKDRLYCAPENTLERRQLDVVLKACFGWWLHMLSALAPRLVHEALAHAGNMPVALPPPPMSASARQQVEQVLSLRRALTPVYEAHAKHLPPARRVVDAQGLPCWPGQLLADALDVAYLGSPCRALESGEFMGGAWTMGSSVLDVCPRCRRAQPSMATGDCQPCAHRAMAGGIHS